MNKLIKIILVVIFIAVTALPFFRSRKPTNLVGRADQAVSPANELQQAFTPTTNPLDWREKQYPSRDGKKILFLRGVPREIELVVKDEKGEMVAGRSIGPVMVEWSLDNNKVAFSDHVASNEDKSYVIDLISKKQTLLEGAEQFVKNLSKTGTYTHVYTMPYGWVGNEQLFVKVTGYPEESIIRPEPQYFLVESQTGKVVKQVTLANVLQEWSEYKNAKYGFSFRHPTTWFPQSGPEFPEGVNIPFFLSGTKPPLNQSNEVFKVSVSEDNRSLESINNQFYPDAKIITVAGKPALKTPENFVIIAIAPTLKLTIMGKTEEATRYFDSIVSSFSF